MPNFIKKKTPKKAAQLKCFSIKYI